MGDLLGDDELEEMRLRDNGDAADTGNHVEAISAKSAIGPDEEQKEQEQQSRPLQPPPGFSANHLFGDVDDDDPLDLVTNLSFLNDVEEVRPGASIPQHRELRPASPTFHRGVMMQEQHARLGGTTDKELLPSFEDFKLLGNFSSISLAVQEEKPPLAKEKSSRFANFFQSETSAPGVAMGPAAATGMAASGASAAGPPSFQNPFSAQLGGQALLQQLQAAQQQQVAAH